MRIVGILHIPPVPASPASNQTPAVTILSHLLDLYPTQVQQPFHLDHRLFVSTSSLLPHSDNKRTFTHIFTSSHVPHTTYVGTTSSSHTAAEPPSEGPTKPGTHLTTITITAGTSLEQVTTLFTQKLQPQWAARQFLVVENGASIKLPLTDDARWRISLGDLRLAQTRISGSGAGQSRGLIVELQYENNQDVSDLGLTNDVEKMKYDALFRNLLKSLLKNIKLDLKLDETVINLIETSVAKETRDLDGQNQEKGDQTQKQVLQRRGRKPQGFEIAELYMEVLRGSRG